MSPPHPVVSGLGWSQLVTVNIVIFVILIIIRPHPVIIVTGMARVDFTQYDDWPHCRRLRESVTGRYRSIINIDM